MLCVQENNDVQGADDARQRADDMATLIDLVVNVAREIRHSGQRDDNVVRLSTAEGTVMRYVDRHPGASAGEIADGTGLQRSNLSAAMRTLESHSMLERRADGRTVHVWPTERSAQNLVDLRREWADRVETVLGDRVGHLGETVELLRVLEEGLVAARRSD